MPYPIINVKTRDGLILHGLLTEPVKPTQTIDIHIHGAGGNFYGNSYFEGLTNRQGGNLTYFQNIHVPILGVIGDQDESEYTIIPIKDAVELLKTENSRAEVYQIEQSNHVFHGKEAEVIELIADFMQRNILV